jgi:hypothetical protein
MLIEQDVYGHLQLTHPPSGFTRVTTQRQDNRFKGGGSFSCTAFNLLRRFLQQMIFIRESVATVLRVKNAGILNVVKQLKEI